MSNELVARWLAGATLLSTPLALGGAHVQTLPWLAVPMALALCLMLLVDTPHRSLRGLWVGRALLVAVVATTLQLVPLPLSLMCRVAAKTCELHRLAAQDAPRAALVPLSLDPAATAGELAKLLLYVLTLATASHVFAARESRRWLLRIVASSGVAVTLVGYTQMALDVHRPYGLFGPIRPLYTATFVNLNHLAGFLGLTALVALTLVLKERGWQRWGWAAAAVLVGSGVFLSLSRGGILAFALALLTLALLAAARRLGRRTGRPAVIAIFIGTISLATIVAYSRVVHELWTLGAEGTLLKAEIWKPVPAMLHAFALLGVGRGAFGAIYPHYKELPHTLTFTHLENEWLQLLVDFGPVVGLVVLALLTLSLMRLMQHVLDRPWRLGLVAALVFVAVHNLMDFSLTLPAVALPALLLLWLGERSAGSATSSPTQARRSIPRRIVLPVGTLAAITACTWVATRFGVEHDTQHLARMAHGGVDAKQVRAEAVAVMRRHPADAILPLLTAETLLRRPGNAHAALSLINHGLYLAPWYYAGHQLAARALLQLGAKEQAGLEYRLACAAEDTACAAMLGELWSKTRDPALMTSMAERGDETLRLRVAALLAQEQAWPQVIEVLQREPPIVDSYAHVLEVQAAMALGDLPRALTAAQRLTSLRPEEDIGYGLQADTYTRLGQPESALAVLEQGAERVRDPSSLIYRTVQLLLTRGAYPEARALTLKLLARSVESQRSAEAHALMAQIYEREGRHAQALREYGKARDRAPAQMAYRSRIATLREQLGDVDGALRELARAEVELGATPEVQDTIVRLRRLRDQRQEDARRSLLLGAPPSP